MWSPVWSDCRARWHAWWPASSDRGSATVWAVGAIAALCAVFGAVLTMGQAVVVRHRAAGAADLAALAAADRWSDGGAAACARAERVALAQGAWLVRCEVEGQISDVTAASGTGPITAEVRSRAGPPGLAEPQASEAPRGFRPPGTSDLPGRPGRPSPRPWPPRTRHSPVRP
ncbi:Rv3654c family TadE-like protein [Streptomyces sp. NPDC002667]|uniref:Rv3654c family TadE-like protein n=1 Tax=Streptomyces sp. NPDC002667 TaxID=3364657 RepID=UPI00368F4FDD